MSPIARTSFVATPTSVPAHPAVRSRTSVRERPGGPALSAAAPAAPRAPGPPRRRGAPGRACRRRVRASACSMLSTVSTPNPHGHAGAQLHVLDAARGLAADVVVVVGLAADDRAEAGDAVVAAGLRRELSAASGSSKAPGTSKTSASLGPRLGERRRARRRRAARRGPRRSGATTIANAHGRRRRRRPRGSRRRGRARRGASPRRRRAPWWCSVWPIRSRLARR